MRITVRDIQKMKDDHEPIVMLTAYDATSARLSEAAGVPMLLVGDSLGMVIQGHETPIPVTLDHIIYHASIVTRVTKQPLVVGDMPFMSYHVSIEQALTNAGRLMQESGVSAIKMEGGESLAETISRVVDAGIPVMAHIGLMPQSVYKVGGMRVQGRDLDSAQQLLRDAHAVQAAGAFAVVLESVPAPLGADDHRTAAYSDDWHWRRAVLRWAGAGFSRYRRAIRGFRAAPYQTICSTGRQGCARRSAPTSMMCKVTTFQPPKTALR